MDSLRATLHGMSHNKYKIFPELSCYIEQLELVNGLKIIKID